MATKIKPGITPHSNVAIKHQNNVWE